MPKLEMHAIREKVEIEVKKKRGLPQITYSEILRVYVTEELTGP